MPHHTLTYAFSIHPHLTSVTLLATHHNRGSGVAMGVAPLYSLAEPSTYSSSNVDGLCGSQSARRVTPTSARISTSLVPHRIPGRTIWSGGRNCRGPRSSHSTTGNAHVTPRRTGQGVPMSRSDEMFVTTAGTMNNLLNSHVVSTLKLVLHPPTTEQQPQGQRARAGCKAAPG